MTDTEPDVEDETITVTANDIDCNVMDSQNSAGLESHDDDVASLPPVDQSQER